MRGFSFGSTRRSATPPPGRSPPMAPLATGSSSPADARAGAAILTASTIARGPHNHRKHGCRRAELSAASVPRPASLGRSRRRPRPALCRSLTARTTPGACQSQALSAVRFDCNKAGGMSPELHKRRPLRILLLEHGIEHADPALIAAVPDRRHVIWAGQAGSAAASKRSRGERPPPRSRGWLTNSSRRSSAAQRDRGLRLSLERSG